MQALFDELHSPSLNTLLASKITYLRRIGMQHVVLVCSPSGMIATVLVPHMRLFENSACQQGPKNQRNSLPWTKGNTGIVKRMSARGITNEVKEDISLPAVLSDYSFPRTLNFREDGNSETDL
jgi:hypothetical protein